MTRFLLPFLFLLFTLSLQAQQEIPADEILSRINKYKEDPRGPYQDIRWYCEDGTIVLPKETCPGKGVQRASYKKEVEALAASNHIFLGQILSNTKKEDFWDASRNHSRLKQYQLERYLQKIDDGWVNRKAQFYRGASQIEDEVRWGTDFLKWVLKNDKNVNESFYLLRQAAKDIPHQAETDLSQRIRSTSKVLGDEYKAFMDIRVKIHGQPDATDLKAVKDFVQTHEAKLNEKQKTLLQELIADMEVYYTPINIRSLDELLKKVASKSELRQSIQAYIENFEKADSESEKIKLTADALLLIRQQFLDNKDATSRLALLDLSNAMETIYLKTIGQWKATTTEDLAEKINAAGKAAAGTGYIELWEWKALAPSLQKLPTDAAAQKDYLANARRLVEWGAGMTRAVYDDVVELYRPFEPKAYGFTDDRVRSSVLLDLGTVVGLLGENFAKDQKSSNYLMGLDNASHARGLNPGYALGELVLIENTSYDMEVDKNKIYVFNKPPSDLKPVAGIATVTEGNLVSHVQLLARNLSIPNAVISDQNFEALRPFAGKKVFYSVNSKGQVVMKPEAKMNETQKELFVKKERSEEKVSVPVERIDLEQKTVLNLRDLNAKSSGVLCGPKAANLAELKLMYPDKVVEGIVIPFGIFREHMDQQMPGQTISYWQFLNNVFEEAAQQSKSGGSEEAVEKFVLEQLDSLRAKITNITFTEAFVADLKTQFAKVLGKPIGEVPVFLRSDTNMEDLKDFTGAGLNLTLFNVVSEEEIISGIKKVWASPYSERSFKWRQRYLLNPENVFPSILIIPSVDVDFSGVLITKGITSDNKEDLTLAISRGAGGAVDGQAAESYLLRADGSLQLMTPAREPGYRRLPVTGGTSKNFATFEQAIADADAIAQIRAFAKTVEETFPKSEDGSEVAAYDIEFGFANGKLWLFQIRPYVESKSDWETAETTEAGEAIEGGNAGDAVLGGKKGSSWLWWLIGGALVVSALVVFVWGRKNSQ
jgi:Pyruvate phosphate dikinase, AMP/ATP-binding domain